MHARVFISVSKVLLLATVDPNRSSDAQSRQKWQTWGWCRTQSTHELAECEDTTSTATHGPAAGIPEAQRRCNELHARTDAWLSGARKAT